MIMQLSGGGTGSTTPSSGGWTTGTVQEVVNLLRAVKLNQDQLVLDSTELIAINAKGVLALHVIVLILGIYLGYLISHYFIPSPRELFTS